MHEKRIFQSVCPSVVHCVERSNQRLCERGRSTSYYVTEAGRRALFVLRRSVPGYWAAWGEILFALALQRTAMGGIGEAVILVRTQWRGSPMNELCTVIASVGKRDYGRFSFTIYDEVLVVHGMGLS